MGLVIRLLVGLVVEARIEIHNLRLGVDLLLDGGPVRQLVGLGIVPGG